MRLTDLCIRALKSPKKGAQIFYDNTVPGFGVRVSQAGTKSFILTHGVRRQRETIGRVGVVDLSEARREAKRRLAEYTLGKHRARAVGWNFALQEYLSQVKAKRRASTHYEYARVLRKHFPFGDTRLTEISIHELQRDLDKLGHQSSEQFHAYICLRAFIRWAYRRHYLDRNPLERMGIPNPSKPRERILTDDELKRVWKAAGDDIFGSIVKLLILTGQRVGEISKLTHSMIGKDAITLPSWLTKNGREHHFPIGPSAISILNIADCSGSALKPTLIFPARGKPNSPFSGFSKSKTRLDKASGVTDWTLHDLRRTFASGLASLGVSLPTVERLLNHISGSFGGIVGVYQRYNFMPEMRAAVEKWDAHLQMLIKT